MTRAAMLADVKRSGLTATDAKANGYKVLTAKQVYELTGNHAAGYLITYHDHNGKPTGYWRVRYTEEVKGPFGAAKKKPLRYTGPKNELPRFYFPKSADWASAVKDPDIEIVITEGEKKADKAVKEGLPCLSVPGVWAWRSKKQGVSAIKDFDVIVWKGRTVYLCFDNDVMTNPQVLSALNALSEELTNRGARVVIKFLPAFGGRKCGLDDYLVRFSADAWLKLKEEPYRKGAALYRLNERLAFVGALGATYDFDNQRFYKSRNDLLYAFANTHYLQPNIDKDGNETFKKVNAAQAWLEWPERREYKNICYVPGEDGVVEGKINLWRGWGVEPRKGSIKPFNDLLNFIFGNEKELRDWFVKWLAYPLQNPGGKNLTCVLLHSRAQGVGKSFIGYIMGEIYGDNFVVIDYEAMRGNFNGWAVNKQFVLGEEITGSNSRSQADRIKNMVTREKIHVNIKYQPEYDLDDRSNYFLTSNHVDALFIEETDRRAVVHAIDAQPQPFEWYKSIDTWRSNGGPSHVFHYLLNEVDLNDYDPKRPAPTTAAKEEMIALSKSDLDLAVDEIRTNPDAILRTANHVHSCPFLTTTQLQSFINSFTGGNSTLIAISKALRRGGFLQRAVNSKEGTVKVWCVRDGNEWRNKLPTDWATEYNKSISVKKF
jgi:hypothetical protein